METRLYGVKMDGIRESFNVRAISRRAAWLGIAMTKKDDIYRILDPQLHSQVDIFPVEDDGRMVLEVNLR